jgi:hypothetical protein
MKQALKDPKRLKENDFPHPHPFECFELSPAG